MAEYVIIGNGVAGIKAVEQIRKSDSDSNITMVGEENYQFLLQASTPGIYLRFSR